MSADHDPQCPVLNMDADDDGAFCECDLIARVVEREARAAADRVEGLPWLDGGRTVNRNEAIMAARGGRKR
jgi:hypothetical protein